MKPSELTATSERSEYVPVEVTTQLEQLRQENEELRKQLEKVLATASSNEKIWRHFAEIERILFRTRELDQLVEELLQEIKSRFQPDEVILFLSHADILERFFPEISNHTAPVGDNTWILPLPAEISCELCANSSKPSLLASPDIQSLLRFLPETDSAAQSGVLIPLCVHKVVFGSLFLGSIDADRYQPSNGTDLLEQLGIKIALCMDNCLTYEKIKDLSIIDPLTGLLNFFQIHTILEKEFKRARRLETALSILVIDLTFFREMDIHFEVGNEVLKHVAALLQEILPKNECFLGRYGSDEFLVVLPDIPEEEAREVVPYFTQMIRKAPFKYQNTAILIQAVIGVASLSDHMKRANELLDAAYNELCQQKVVCSQPPDSL